ncbi:DUF2953 domain-containing protein [Virgibacillus sp. NKC19-16]|uniref:DUF2953 domain-containing protein n=1 Tax=Virgibacillus salidurans TaxID=2831673 RepID=UPI001F3F6EA9|nr:DUF2953 domain-containing protein [Virgibacillus sp. NKC19-16]UJL45075.1 DUF2953 domain-containing protein [Virgibacillus sp. NKC19-16]
MLWILLAVVLLILILLLSRITITGNVTYTQREQSFTVTVSLYRVRLYKKKANITMENKDTRKGIRDINFDSFQGDLREAIELLRELNPFVDYILKNTYVHKLKWLTAGGTGDASSTGIAAGGVWAIKGIFIGIITEKSNLTCKPVIRVSPHFQQQHFLSTFDCMVSLKLGKAMYTLLKVMQVFSRKEKEFS